MTAAELNPTRTHYTHLFDERVRAMAAFQPHAEHLDTYGLGEILALMLPGVLDLHGCWAELQEPLTDLERLDGNIAVSIVQERGVRHVNVTDAMDQVRGEYLEEIDAVVRRYRAAAVKAA